MPNSIQVNKNCTASAPGYPDASFVTAQIVPSSSPYYFPLLWSGNATDSGVPNTLDSITPVGARRVTMSLGAPKTQNAAGALTNWAERIPLMTPMPTFRWRLRVANRFLNPTGAGNPLTQQFTISDVFLGLPISGTGTPADGRPRGGWAATPTKVILGSDLSADGSDWVSPWVTDPALQLGPDRPRQLGLALSGTNNGNGSGVTGTHYGHRSTSAGCNAVVGSQLARTGYVGNTLALDKRIEYEFYGTQPIGLYIGASGDEGYNLVTALDGGGGYEPVYAWETWMGVMGMRSKIPWINAAIVGATQTPYMSASNLAFSRFDLATTVPDFAVIGLGGNSILAGTALATIQSELATVFAQVRALGINRIYHETVVPVGAASGSATENLRNSYNNWLRTNPYDALSVIDVDLITRDPANNLQQLPGFVDTDKIHPNLAGYQNWGTNVSRLN